MFLLEFKIEKSVKSFFNINPIFRIFVDDQLRNNDRTNNTIRVKLIDIDIVNHPQK